MIELFTLGSTHLHVDGERLRSMTSHKQKLALLVYVALEGPVAREHLLDLFWGETEEEKARHSLAQVLYVLRTIVGHDVLASEGDMIATDPGTVRVDAQEFAEAAREERWSDALQLYTGPFLHQFSLSNAREFEQWQSATALRFSQLARQAFSESVDRRRGSGDFEGAITIAQRWARLEPLADEAQHALIELLSHTGKRSLALREYELYRERLERELGASPADETIELVEKIKAGRTPASVGGDGGATEMDGSDGAASAPSVESPRDALSDRYIIERELAGSVLTKVHLANDRRYDRPVAIKVLRKELTPSVSMERFMREISVAAQLNHPHLVPVYDSGESDGSVYYVMPYIPGDTLRERLEDEPQLPIDEAIRIITQVSAGASYAHSRGIVHRELKPENVLLYGDHAYVTDFGIARAMAAAGSKRLTETGLILGTPEYMSPEQARGSGELDGRSDLYSIACILFEMLAGYPPFSGVTPQVVRLRHLKDPVPKLRSARPEVPEGVEEAINRALAKTPTERFDSAEEFAQALQASSEPG